MMPLKLIENNKHFCIYYKNSTDYFKILGELEEEMYGLISNDEICKKARIKHYQSCPYSLKLLLLHLKAIQQKYKNYIILDYYFKGFYLKNNTKMSKAHCILTTTDEEYPDMSVPLLGKSLTEFIEVLTFYSELGDVVVESIQLKLMNNKTHKIRKRTNIPQGLRHEVFKRDNYTCIECGAKKEEGVTLHVDHKIPVSKGGTDELSNLQTLCHVCNLNKNNLIQ